MRTNENLVSSDSTYHYFLCVLVLSTVKGLDRRNGIRESWMKNYQKKTPRLLLQFSIGISNISPSEVKELEIEQGIHGDLLLLSDFDDFDSNLAMKVLMSLMKLEHNFAYLFKCDDNTFVDMDTLFSELRERDSTKNLYWGYHEKRKWVVTVGKNAETNHFPCNTYLPYAAGIGYILSCDLVKRFTSNADGLVFHNNEDTTMGVWLSPYKIERRHDERFNYKDVDCQNNLIVSNQFMNRKEMLNRQTSLDERGSICTTKEEHQKVVYNFLNIMLYLILFYFTVFLIYRFSIAMHII